MSEMNEIETVTEVASTSPSKDERNLAMLAHLLGAVTGFVGALVIWLVKKDESKFVEQEAREALNFQVTLLIGWFICYVLMFVLIGFVLMPVLWLVNVVLSIVAAVAASKGTAYKYPFALRLIN